ncbi:hypothetical protein MSMEI_6067 [Mycolicibacterium smegmatis MC2 155]|uniref:Uncharacterized protein n=1 Tax=Mycolicibacterium smegmatis (strain ATCC 700084 / mc(2)155) TaxID=246196 RepID=I7FUE3_MYCS2|nr:hypothetical protein MSMEI_6067 [Mycolicibacterium smegmatis MC2 155]
MALGEQDLQFVVVLRAQHGVVATVVGPHGVGDLACQFADVPGAFGYLPTCGDRIGLLADQPRPVVEVALRGALVGVEHRQDETRTGQAGLDERVGLATALALHVGECHRAGHDQDREHRGRHREPHDAGFGVGNPPAPHEVREDHGGRGERSQGGRGDEVSDAGGRVGGARRRDGREQHQQPLPDRAPALEGVHIPVFEADDGGDCGQDADERRHDHGDEAVHVGSLRVGHSSPRIW